MAAKPDDMLEFRLVGLAGPIVPYVRMTQRGKWKPRAQRYLASQQALKIQLRQQMTAKDDYEPLTREPIEVYLAFWWANHRQDLDNLVKAVLDAASGVVWADDRWVDRITACRVPRREQTCFLQVRTVGAVEKLLALRRIKCKSNIQAQEATQ